MRCSSVILVGLAAVLVACGGEDRKNQGSSTGDDPPDEPECALDVDCGGEKPLCDLTSGTCQALPPGWEIGYRDGSPGSVAFVQVFFPDAQRGPMDLQFNPSKPTELWVVNHSDDSAIIIQSPGAPEMVWERRRDPAANHFMESPPAIAFGAVIPQWGQSFAVCGDDDNSANGMADFMGPALFPAALDVFAKQTPGGLGSHVDMLHSSNFCRGIAHLFDSAYMLFNSERGSLDKYDFRSDHGPGNDDHSDGQIFRYVEGAVAGVDDVPSHLVLNPADGWVYVADTGNKRIAKMDPNSGAPGSSFSGFEPVDERRKVDGAVIVDFVPFGLLEAPSGIEVKDGLVYVSDNAMSRFYVFDGAGQEIRHLDTGGAPGSLAGFTFGPDGKIYFVDMVNSGVFRIDPL